MLFRADLEGVVRVEGEALLQAGDVALVHDQGGRPGAGRDLEEPVRGRDEAEVP